jgi:hypothetical protein
LNTHQAARDSAPQRPPATAGRRQCGARVLLGCLGAYAAAIGAYALLAPHAFYRNVIGVDLLGPYNEHLVSDVGGLYLGFSSLFAWGAWTLGRELVRAICITWTLVQAIRFTCHLAHLQHFTVDQATAQPAGLLPLLLLPGWRADLAPQEGPMRIFLAGAAGVIGRSLTPILVREGP